MPRECVRCRNPYVRSVSNVTAIKPICIIDLSFTLGTELLLEKDKKKQSTWIVWLGWLGYVLYLSVRWETCEHFDCVPDT